MTKIKIEVEINTSNSQHITAMNAFLDALGSKDGEADETSKQENPPKEAAKTKKPTKKIENTKNAQEKAPEEKAPEEKAPEEKAPEEISLTELRAILSTKVNEHRSEIKNKLTEFGASSLSTLESSHYQDFADFLNSL